MTDDIDKKFEKLVKEKKQAIKRLEDEQEEYNKRIEVEKKKNVEKFREIYSDLKKVCKKFGTFGKNNIDDRDGLTIYFNTRRIKIVLDNQRLELEVKEGVLSKPIFHNILPDIVRNCFIYNNTARGITGSVERIITGSVARIFDSLELKVYEKDDFAKNESGDVKYYSKIGEILFYSKEKLIDFIIRLILENLTDEEVKRYFKK